MYKNKFLIWKIFFNNFPDGNNFLSNESYLLILDVIIKHGTIYF